MTNYYMKEKNLPDYNDAQSFEELTREVNRIIEELENQEDLKNSLDDYQKLIKLNNIIEKKFQKESKNISQNIKEKIKNIIGKKKWQMRACLMFVIKKKYLPYPQLLE